MEHQASIIVIYLCFLCLFVLIPHVRSCVIVLHNAIRQNHQTTPILLRINSIGSFIMEALSIKTWMFPLNKAEVTATYQHMICLIPETIIYLLL